VGGGHLKTLLSYNAADIADTFDVDGASATVNVGTPTIILFDANNHAISLRGNTYASDGSKALTTCLANITMILNQFFIVPTMDRAPPFIRRTIDTTSYAGLCTPIRIHSSTKLFAALAIRMTTNQSTSSNL